MAADDGIMGSEAKAVSGGDVAEQREDDQSEEMAVDLIKKDADQNVEVRVYDGAPGEENAKSNHGDQGDGVLDGGDENDKDAKSSEVKDDVDKSAENECAEDNKRELIEAALENGPAENVVMNDTERADDEELENGGDENISFKQFNNLEAEAGGQEASQVEENGPASIAKVNIDQEVQEASLEKAQSIGSEKMSQNDQDAD